MDHFFQIPITFTDELVQDLANGLELLFQEYTAFVASCGNVVYILRVYAVL